MILRFLFLASGEGTLFEGLTHLLRKRDMQCVGLITDRACRAEDRAHRLGIDVFSCPYSPLWEDKIIPWIKEKNPDWILLAGFLRKLDVEKIQDEFPHLRGRILNSHPSLLPKFGGPGFYGRKIYEEVLKSGESETGVTIHTVTSEIDRGPIVKQRAIPLAEGESLESLQGRVKVLELQVWQDFFDELSFQS